MEKLVRARAAGMVHSNLLLGSGDVLCTWYNIPENVQGGMQSRG